MTAAWAQRGMRLVSINSEVGLLTGAAAPRSRLFVPARRRRHRPHLGMDLSFQVA